MRKRLTSRWIAFRRDTNFDWEMEEIWIALRSSQLISLHSNGSGRRRRCRLSCRLFGNELALFRTCQLTSSGEKSPRERLIDSLFALTTNLRFVPSVSRRERRDDKRARRTLSIAPVDHFPVNNSQTLKCVSSLSACKRLFADDWHSALFCWVVSGVRESESTFYIRQDGKAFAERDVIWARGERDDDEELLTHWTEYLEPPQSDFDVKGFK